MMKMITNHNKPRTRVPVNVQLPVEIRQLLEAAIDHDKIRNLTESVIDAVKRRAESQPPKGTAMITQFSAPHTARKDDDGHWRVYNTNGGIEYETECQEDAEWHARFLNVSADIDAIKRRAKARLTKGAKP
jgi:hypothetical protein